MIIEQYILTLHVTSEVYGPKNVTVTVKWTQLEGAVYTVRLSPPVPIMVAGSTSRLLTISYNTEHNFSVDVITVAPCRTNTTAFIRLHFGEIHNNIILLFIIKFFVWQLIVDIQNCRQY